MTMGKRSRMRKARERAMNLASQSLELDNANGRLRPQDVDFVTRMRRESRGEEGYTGSTRKDYEYSGYGYGGYGYPYQNGRYQVGVDNHTFKTDYTPSPKRDEEVFHCEETGELTKECPIAITPSILIDYRMWETFLNATKEFSTEWIALLIGKLDKDSKGNPAYVIEKFYLPPQTASGAHVDVPTGVKPRPNTIGAIHSHVNMGVFFSGTDIAHSNWPVEIVINRKEQYEAVARHKLKCGEWAKTKAKVFLTGSYLSDSLGKAFTEAFEKGKKLSETSRQSPMTHIHEEDKEDVSKAITVTSGQSTTTYVPPSGPTDAPTAGQGDLLFGHLDDPPLDPTLCDECEGTGWVEDTDSISEYYGIGGVTPAPCKKCGNTGLSELGRIRKAEEEKGKSTPTQEEGKVN
jgi:hypothetical protein